MESLDQAFQIYLPDISRLKTVFRTFGQFFLDIQKQNSCSFFPNLIELFEIEEMQCKTEIGKVFMKDVLKQKVIAPSFVYISLKL